MSDKLEKLRKQKEQIDAEIQNVLNLEKQKARKEENRKKIMIGAFFMNEIKNGRLTEYDLARQLDAYLTKTGDRELFGLEPKAEKKQDSDFSATQYQNTGS